MSIGLWLCWQWEDSLCAAWSKAFEISGCFDNEGVIFVYFFVRVDSLFVCVASGKVISE